ncbi:MAG: NADH-quinone oxidoreductase subunit C [Burkholderiales bacterium]
MTHRLEVLRASLLKEFSAPDIEMREHLDELTMIVPAVESAAIARALRDRIGFEQLIDLCAVDYLDFGTEARQDSRIESTHSGRAHASRFCVVYHLLSLQHNRRLRVKTFAPDPEFPVLDSVTDVWPNADWYEREAFDLFGIVFNGHPDLRRILTDYGFVGHPFRRDFPAMGQVEVRYDPEQGRVVYQPLTIEQRNNVPRIVREGETNG